MVRACASVHDVSMANAFRVVLLAAAACFAIASATAPKAHEVRRQSTIKASFDEAWDAVIDVFANRSIPVATLEKDSGLIVSEWGSVIGWESVRDCGSPGIAVVKRDVGKFNVRVKRVAEGVKVTVNSHFKQVRDFDGIVSEEQCNSTGQIEELVLRAVANAGAGTKIEMSLSAQPVLGDGLSSALANSRERLDACAVAQGFVGDLATSLHVRDGNVVVASIGHESAEFKACLEKIIADWQLPKSRKPRLVELALEFKDPKSGLPEAGSNGGACYGNGTCDEGLSCSDSKVCEAPEVVDGHEGGVCYGNGTCNDDLVCGASKLCEKKQAIQGREGGLCYGNGTCNEGLSCSSDGSRCTRAADSSNTAD